MKETENLGTNEETETFFFDTYAIFEIVYGNPRYDSYTNAQIITTKFNLAELNYNLKKDISIEKADKLTEKYWNSEVEVTLEDIKKAMDLKSKKRKLSIPDAIGYTVAKRHKVKFLTGDEDFNGMGNVEFVKR